MITGRRSIDSATQHHASWTTIKLDILLARVLDHRMAIVLESLVFARSHEGDPQHTLKAIGKLSGPIPALRRAARRMVRYACRPHFQRFSMRIGSCYFFSACGGCHRRHPVRHALPPARRYPRGVMNVMQHHFWAAPARTTPAALRGRENDAAISTLGELAGDWSDFYPDATRIRLSRICPAPAQCPDRRPAAPRIVPHLAPMVDKIGARARPAISNTMMRTSVLFRKYINNSGVFRRDTALLVVAGSPTTTPPRALFRCEIHPEFLRVT